MYCVYDFVHYSDLQVTMDILIHFLNPHCCELHLNHGNLLESIWSWTGVKAEHRHKVAEVHQYTCVSFSSKHVEFELIDAHISELSFFR